MNLQTTKASFPAAAGPNGYLDLMYTAAREAHGPSDAAWSRIAASIDVAAQTPPGADVIRFAPGGGGFALPFAPSFMRFAGLTCAGLIALGGYWLAQSPPDAALSQRVNGSQIASAAPNGGSLGASAIAEQNITGSQRTVVEDITATGNDVKQNTTPSALNALETPRVRNVSPSSQRAYARSRSVAQPHGTQLSHIVSANGVPRLPIASGETLAPEKTSLAVAAANPNPANAQDLTTNDAALLRDLALLDRVEALLRQHLGRAALELLQAEPVSLLNAQAGALKAAAQCQTGETARGRQLLAAISEHGPAATTRARALRYCGVLAVAPASSSR